MIKGSDDSTATTDTNRGFFVERRFSWYCEALLCCLEGDTSFMKLSPNTNVTAINDD